LRRAPAALAMLALCALTLARPAAETSDHQRLSVRRPESVAVSFDLDLELGSPREGFLEGCCTPGFGLDIGGWLDVGLSMPLLASIDLGKSCRRSSRFTFRPGRGDLRLDYGFSAGAWRLTADADLGYAPATEGGSESISLGLGLGAMRFLDPLALGANLSVGTSFARGDEGQAPLEASPPLSLSLGLLALEALNSDASFVIQLVQSLASPGGDMRRAGGWAYSATLGLRFVLACDRWALRVGFTGLEHQLFQSGASFVWRPREPSGPSP